MKQLSSHKLYPKLLAEFHPSLNDLPLLDFIYSSKVKVWWQCKYSHWWQESIYNRIYFEYGCPFCSGHRVDSSNCIAKTHSEILSSWHPTKNLPLTPNDITFGSRTKIWWLCENGHERETTILNRIKYKCPHCKKKKTERNVHTRNEKRSKRKETMEKRILANLRPDLISEWHPDKNRDLNPFKITIGSNIRAWWVCSEGHEWQTKILHRAINNSGCPICRESKGEKRTKYFLDQMKINYITEKTFEGCKDKQSLRFDFYLSDFHAIIEYDGLQHFESSKSFGGIPAFEKVKERDSIKNEFCANNNMPLLRIPYTKFDEIEKEITSFISNLQPILQSRVIST